MQRHDTSKQKTSSSINRRSDGKEEENQPQVHYELIKSDLNDTTTAKQTTSAKDMAKDSGGSKNLGCQNPESSLKRFKRKFKRIRSRNSGEERETGSQVNVQSGVATRSLTNYQQTSQREHIYEVPFSNSGVDNESDEEHIYQNGHIWAANNKPRRYSGPIRDQSESSNENSRGRNATGGRSDWRQPHSLLDDDISSDRNSRRERWQQGKSMSLPAAGISLRSSGQYPLPGVGSSRRNTEMKSTGGDSSSGSSNEEVIEPSTDNKEATNSLMMRTRSLPMPSKMDCSHQFLNGLNDLCKCGWYWGPLTSKEAEVKLHGKPDGSFLVRDSNDNRYLLSLSFRSEGTTLHTRIEFCKGKFSFYAAPFITSGCHESIVDLIEDCVQKSRDRVFCYSKGRRNNGASFPVRLMKPLSRFEHVCTLQHLCRFVIRQHFTLENIGGMALPGMMKRYLGKNHFDAKQG